MVSAVGSVVKSLTSAPPLNRPFAPVKITVVTDASFSAASTSASSSAESANESALTGGLSSVIRRMPSPASALFTRCLSLVVVLMILLR